MENALSRSIFGVYEKFKIAKLSGCMRADKKCTHNNSRLQYVAIQNYFDPRMVKPSGFFYRMLGGTLVSVFSPLITDFSTGRGKHYSYIFSENTARGCTIVRCIIQVGI